MTELQIGNYRRMPFMSVANPKSEAFLMEASQGTGSAQYDIESNGPSYMRSVGAQTQKYLTFQSQDLLEIYALPVCFTLATDLLTQSYANHTRKHTENIDSVGRKWGYIYLIRFWNRQFGSPTFSATIHRIPAVHVKLIMLFVETATLTAIA